MTRLTVEQALSMAELHRREGRAGPAEAICGQILRQHPGEPQALFLLASLQNDGGRLQEAARLLTELVARHPADESAQVVLGSVLRRLGQLDDAAAVLGRALERFPQSSALCQGIGLVERARGELPAAIAWFRRALQQQPDSVEVLNNLGLTLTEAGQTGEAIGQFEVALQARPDVAQLHYNLGIALAAAGRQAEAAAAYRRATELSPEYVEAWINLGASLKPMGRLDGSIAAFEQALRLQPRRAEIHAHLAGVYEWQARHDDALAAYRTAMSLAPEDAAIHGSFLFTLLFHPRQDARALRAAHDDWNRRHAQGVAILPAPRDRDRSPRRRLRVGYVGGFFRDHVVGRNLLPLFREHDREAVEVFCYSGTRQADDLTEDFRRLTDAWRDIAAASDAEVAAQVRADAVDILVDTSLHMDSRRLLVFARRPAPVQVTFAGYPGTTGLSAIDYRLTDAHLDPPGADESAYAERSVRLPHTFWCYDPLGEVVPVGPLPADREGAITFGCLNNFSKVNDGVIDLWARVLHAVAGSRLHVLCHEGSHRQRTLETLQRLGIEPRRIGFRGYRPRLEYLATFNEIDISLDTLPYNGHTTGLDSLWMGVPVVTRVGETVVGRAGLSQLANIGLTDLVAHSADEYVAIAAALAADRARLGELRRSLRRRMEESPLMDAPRFARGIEAAYRQMWQRWCTGTCGPEEPSAAPPEGDAEE